LREIVFDTETTGLDPYQGHRLIEIGCYELLNRIPSGQSFHRYINPERDVPAEAVAIHGLTAERLKGEPLFAEIADELITFIADAPLVAHNAMFDLGFLNAELERAGKTLLQRERLVDTLLLARRKHPGASNRLDDLCQRYGIDNSRRTKHGGLVEAGTAVSGARVGVIAVRLRPTPLAPRVSAEERAAHAAFIATLGASALWREYSSEGVAA
jgi:DNA polymerase III subunit epsilon